ncbi:uncharacterized protein [Spinacia oleracea]|uniref:Uncharacterized protein isoform X1 n=1 Tax=Spinacia oleracea TaxID=3562 RepID=A0A9R0IRM1_SPIOL|nr:uncharacterized protein LOC110793684 isoform X1 [Spinacia oleracea]XP_056697445.1 uncharacterized protein LOC110793684 isoform X1 [Spinacia oleracea]
MDDDSVNSGGCGGGTKRMMEIEVAIDSGGGGGGGGGMEIDGGETVTAKRRKKEEVVEMKRVAEIVLVLSALGRMRAGRDPTVAEKAMMAEAREKVVTLCQELAPKDILPTEAFGVVIEDLGLNRLKERVGGFRPTKISISDKIALSKRRMEESKVFAVQPASYPSQRVQTASGAVSENRGPPPTVRVVPSDKVGQMPVSTGTFQPPIPVANPSSAASAPMRFHPPSTEVRPPALSSAVLNNMGRDSTSVMPPRLDRANIRPDVRPNGKALPHVPVSSAANQHMVRTTPVHLRPQTPMQVNLGTKNMVPGQLQVKSESNASLSAPQMTSQSAVAPTPGLVTSHTVPGMRPTMHHPIQGMPFVHAPAVNHHLEVSRIVQKFLTPKVPPRPVWTPPSRDYMNRATSCQFCKLVINEVENMVVCDACEKGFHLGCLQSHNAKSIPRVEWHCPRCISMSNGKPFPPKYGRVTRNMNVPKVLSNTIGVQLPSERKAETMDEKMNQSNAIIERFQDFKTHSKVNQPNAMIDRIQDFKTHSQVSPPNATTNGSQDSKVHSHAAKVAEPSSESNLPHESEMNRNDVSIGIKEDESKLENCSSNMTAAAVEPSLSTSNEPSSDKPSLQVKSEISPSEDRLMSETEPETPEISHANNKLDGLPISSNQNDVDQKVLDNVEIPAHQHCDSNDLPISSNQNDVDQKVLDNVEIPAHQHSDSNGVIETHQCKDDKNDEKDVPKNLVEMERVGDQTEELTDASEICLHSVDWVGDTDRVVDEKKFFRSCRINEIVYQLHDYALLRAGNGKILPVKLQDMWEDQTSLKWLVVHKCYFPDDLPNEVGRPGAPQNNEVYESTHDSTVLAGFVQGPCEVLPFRKFGDEAEKSDQGSPAKDRRQPVFIRNWFYDETRRAFCPNAS